jgi:hypothetical protein
MTATRQAGCIPMISGACQARLEARENMNLSVDPPRPMGDIAPAQSDAAVLWHHAAFCRMALPLRAQKVIWQRVTPQATIRIEPGATGQALPCGPVLRMVLLHLCDTALRRRDPVVALGESAAAFAATLGIPAKAAAVQEQVARIIAAKISVAVDGSAESAVLDARGRPRAADAPWRPSLRLSSRFLASLAEHAVPLEQRALAALREQPLALDAWCWIAQQRYRQPAGDDGPVPWSGLLDAFGTPSQGIEEFRSAFEAALRLAAAAEPGLAILADDAGVRLAAQAVAPAAAALPAPAPAPEPPPAAASAAPTPAIDPVAVLPGTAAPVAPAAPAPAAPVAPVAPPEPARPRSAEPAVVPAQALETVCFGSELTGLPQVIWLRRGYGPDGVLVGVTPTERFDASRLTLLAVEPMVVQVSGGVNQPDFDRISAWIMVNRDLIDDIWAGQIASRSALEQRVRKAPAPGWR